MMLLVAPKARLRPALTLTLKRRKGPKVILQVKDLKTLENLQEYVDTRLAGASLEFDSKGMLVIKTNLTATAYGTLVELP